MKSVVEKAAKDIRPSSYLDYRIFLESLYQYIKRESAQYSYQKFSQDLGFNASTLMHQIVRGYRPLSGKTAERVAKTIGLDSIERKYFLAMVSFNNAKSSSKRAECFENLLSCKREALPEEQDRDKLSYFSEWYHPVIWELIGSPDFNPDPKWICERITPRLKTETVEESLQLLLRLGLIVYDVDTKSYTQTQTRVSTGHRVEGVALVSYHQSMIEHGKAALTQIQGDRRDVSAVTLNISEETALKLKSMIHAFQLQLLDEAERAGAGDQVYQVNIQLFPFTKKDS